jgi:hypothetical protein
LTTPPLLERLERKRQEAVAKSIAVPDIVSIPHHLLLDTNYKHTHKIHT